MSFSRMCYSLYVYSIYGPYLILALAEHALITWLIMHWSRDWSCNDLVSDHALITWLSCTDHVAIMQWSRGYHAQITWLFMQWTHSYHILVTWLIMHWSRGWSCTDHVTDHALITWLSCTDHLAGHTLITCLSCTDPVTKHEMIT